MTETKTNRQRRLAKNERDEKAWLNIRAKSYDERRDMAAEVLAEFLLKEATDSDTTTGLKEGGAS
jgi:hypothetical protein